MGREANARLHASIDAARSAVTLLDRFGRPIMEGNSYTYQSGLPQVYTVDSIVPVLDRPDLPPGMFRVNMTARVTLIMANHGRADELALCYMRVAQPPPAADIASQTNDSPAEPVPDSSAPSPAVPEGAPDGPDQRD